MVYRDNKFIRIELDQDNHVALVKSKSFINDKEYQRSWYARQIYYSNTKSTNS
jgi:hypothetical protein